MKYFDSSDLKAFRNVLKPLFLEVVVVPINNYIITYINITEAAKHFEDFCNLRFPELNKLIPFNRCTHGLFRSQGIILAAFL